MTEKKKKTELWGDLASSLDDMETFDFDATEEKPEGEEKKKGKVKRGKKATTKGDKEKKSTPASEKKRGRLTKKADLAVETPSFLDPASIDFSEAKLDLTVGADETKTAKRGRKRVKKASADELIQQVEKEEAKKEKAKRRKLAEAIEEEAVRPFREIAGQIEERIQELTEEESGKKPTKSRTKKTGGRRKKTSGEEPETSDNVKKPVEKKADPTDDDFWADEETLEISWGRSPKTTSVEETTPPEEEIIEERRKPTPSENESEEQPANDDVFGAFRQKGTDEDSDWVDDDDSEELPKDLFGFKDEEESVAPKLSREDAEDRFAQFFTEAPVEREKVEELNNRLESRGGRKRRGSKKEVAEPVQKQGDLNWDDLPEKGEVTDWNDAPVAEKPSRPSIDNNDFWGIPDEPEIGFASPAKKRVESPEKAPVDAPAPERRREERPSRHDRGQRADRPSRDDARKDPRPDSRNDRTESRRERPEREPGSRSREEVPRRPDRREEFGEAREIPSDSKKSEGETALFPTWQDAIADVIQFNINRHSSGKGNGGNHGHRGGGGRRR